MPQISSKVWRIHGLAGRATPGILHYDNGRVQFITEEGLEFDEPLIALHNIKWPFLRIGLGFDATVNEVRYKFSFAKPNPSAPELGDDLAEQLMRFSEGGKIWEAIKSFKNLRTDKETCRLWKEILKEQR
jgi:hypothetical protein